MWNILPKRKTVRQISSPVVRRYTGYRPGFILATQGRSRAPRGRRRRVYVDFISGSYSLRCTDMDVIIAFRELNRTGLPSSVYLGTVVIAREVGRRCRLNHLHEKVP